VDQLRPDLVVIAVRADSQVKVGVEPERGELGPGHGGHVPGQHRLHDRRAQRGHGGQRGRRAGQGTPAGRDGGPQLRCPPGQLRDERVHVPGRIADPGHGQGVGDDRPLGAPAHRGHLIRVAAEQVAEDRAVDRPAVPARVEQRVVHVPQHQQVPHAATLSTRRAEPGKTGGGQD
jgi:hypothetical protein